MLYEVITISKQIVELMGGTIGLHSAPSVGSTFWFQIEFKKHGSGDISVHPEALDGLNVLMIAHQNAYGIGDSLTAWGIQQTWESNPEHALKMLPNLIKCNKSTIIIVDKECP